MAWTGGETLKLHVLVALLQRALDRIRELPTGWCSLWVAVALGLLRATMTASSNMCNGVCCPGYWPSIKGGCDACTPGYYCNSGVGRTPCPTDTFNALTGATDATWCRAYATRCAPGQYITHTPNATQNISCMECRGVCGQGQYKAGACDGTEAYDVVTCVDCRTCESGKYHSTPCDGTPPVDPPCTACTDGGCPTGQYRGPCSQNSNGACTTCTACGAGRYNKGCGGNQDGVCTPCTVCGVGWEPARACSALEDTICKGGTCNASTTCGALFCSYPVKATPGCTKWWLDIGAGTTNYLCVTSETAGTCQECPPGWMASGAYCVECPAGKSCDTMGRPQCEGQCAVDYSPTCNTATQRSVCTGCYANHTALAIEHKILTRGGVLDTPGLCGAYFQCAIGYYLASVSTTTMGCLPCAWPEASQSAWAAVSHGLTFGDAYSCLYVSTTQITPGNAGNALGFYGALRTSCPMGTTSIPTQANAIEDCVTCPNPPAFGSFASQRYDCAVTCLDGYVQRGELCVDTTAVPCSEDGFVEENSVCLPQALPWSAPGWFPTGMPTVASLSTVEVAAYDGGYYASPTRLYTPSGVDLCASVVATVTNLGYVEDKALTSVACGDIELHRFYMLRMGGAFLYAFLERTFGNNNRYIMWQIETRTGQPTLRGQVLQRWRLPGRVCSAAWTRAENVETMYMAFCNTSFLAFALAPDTTAGADTSGLTRLTMDSNTYTLNRRVGVLIGTDGVSGSMDGMRDVALFGASLSVANTTDPRRLLVADRFNCRLVEVIIDTAGSFLTRATTIGVHTCYSVTNALPFPRLLTSVFGGAVALFVTNSGVHQIDGKTRSVQDVTPLDLMPLDPAWLGVANGGSTVLLYNGTHAAALQRTQAQCPSGKFARRGGECIPCPSGTWASGAECRTCGTPACGEGTRLVPCSGNADAYCQPCAAPSPAPGFQYHFSPECDIVPVAPCPAGYYNTTEGGDCFTCPSFASGAYTAAGASQAMVCGCFHEAGRMANETCLVPSPFASGVGPFPAPGWTQGLNCTFRECNQRGCFLASAFPRLCSECPDGTVGRNGMWCETCPGFRDPNPTKDGCLCRPPASFALNDDACMCPAGHEILGQLGCTPCPPGFYQGDYLRIHDDHHTQMDMCTECPPGYGSQAAASDCAPCPPGLYREPGMQECARCADSRAYATNRASRASCRTCQSACAAGEEWKPCPADPTLFACEACAAELFADREWVPGADNRACLWRCKEGYFQANGDCWPCSDGTGAPPCAAGKIRTPCSAYADANCDRACANSSMPLANAVWSGVGCEWKCVDGKTLLTKTLFGWTEFACVDSEELAARPWSGWW